MSVINIRGTNGSGKSYLVRQWLALHKGIPYPQSKTVFGGLVFAQRTPEYYILDDGGVIIGGYVNECGGCDVIDTQSEIRDRIRQYLHAPYVLFEGVIVSTIFESWHNFSRTIGGTIWAYMDTPVDLCVARVRQRNASKSFNEKLLRDKYRQIMVLQREKAILNGEKVVLLDHRDPVNALRRIIL